MPIQTAKKLSQLNLPLNNIHIGMFIRNYRELCYLLEQPVKNGTAKVSQLKQFAQQLDLAKNGNSFIILDIYNKIIPKERKITESTMIKSYLVMEDLVKDIDYSKDISITYRTQKDLQLLLGICNESFYDNKKFANKSLSSDIYNTTIFANIPIECVLDFYTEVNSRGYSEVDRLVTILDKQKLVSVVKTYSVSKDKEKRVFTYATEAEFIHIREAKCDTLLLDQYQRRGKEEEVLRMTEQEIYLRKRTKEFTRDVLLNPKLVSLGITSYYTIYKFTFSSSLEDRKERYGQILGIKDDFNRLLNVKAIKYHENRSERNIKNELSKLISMVKAGNETIDSSLENGYFFSLRHYYIEDRDTLTTELVTLEGKKEVNKVFSINIKELLTETVKGRLVMESLDGETGEFREYMLNEFKRLGWVVGGWSSEVKEAWEINKVL
jgi:hypothetical protein